MILNHLKLRVDSEDQSFMPTQVSVYARESSPDKNTLLKDVHIRENTKYNRAVTLLGQQKKYHCFILLKINNMMQGGQDCKLRAIEISASLPPLKTKPYIAPPSPYYDRSDKTQLYVWGLNVSDQILKREGRILTPTQSKQISQMEIKDVQMSSKGTIILNKSGIVSIIGDLAPKPATANGSEIRTITAGVGFIAISTHCTGRHWLGLDRLNRVWSCDASTNEIRQIPNLNDVIDISAGYEYSLALDRRGRVFGWGNNKNYRVDPKDCFILDG